MEVGVVVERRAATNPWADWTWRVIAVLPGTAGTGWRRMVTGDGWTRYFAGSAVVDLHRADTEAYVHNLESREPAVYVVLSNRENPTEDQPYDLSQVTVSPYEAQDVLDSAEELVERIPMPPVMIEWVQAFVDAHHVERKFVKRKRDRVELDERKFGNEPIHEVRRRMHPPVEPAGNGGDGDG